MDPNCLIAELQATRAFFDRSTSCLTEKDSEFAPKEPMMTVAQQVMHVAQTVDWFFEGAFRPEGFDLDFERHMAEVRETRSLEAARAALAQAFENAIATLGTKSADDLAAPLPDGPVMGGQPRVSIISAIGDHTAHHRGTLTVYSRLLGYVPEMPYAG